MQVYILKSDLSNTQPTIAGNYDDLTPLPDRNLLGSNYAVLTVPTGAMSRDSVTNRFILKPDWRTQNVDMVINGEAYRRIIESFTEFMQRNANTALASMVTKYGPNSSTWPQAARDCKATIDAGYAYIDAVRQQSDALSSQDLPTDPTDDSHWPTRIQPVYIPMDW